MKHPFKPVVFLPTYNNAGSLDSVLSAVSALNIPILVVNDGSTDATSEILQRWSSRATVISHATNQGKAAALRTGFRHALNAGHTHAATIDTDGQHDPTDLPRLIDLARHSPGAIILGVRDINIADYPASNLLARRLSNLAIRLQTGATVQDSQCGLRVYPISLMSMLKTRSKRFGFEAEVITRAAWAGCTFIETPVHCTYTPAGGRVTHYIQRRDSPRAVFMHLMLLARSFLPLPQPRWG
jgi:glycosyltransferase involved in cell wall biosynthesis